MKQSASCRPIETIFCPILFLRPWSGCYEAMSGFCSEWASTPKPTAVSLLHTIYVYTIWCLTLQVRVTLRLAVYRKPVHLGAKPLEVHDQREFIFFNWTLAVIALVQHPLLREDGFASYEHVWAFVKCTYRTYSMLLKILSCAIYTSPLSVQALQSRLCLSYVSYATTAA
jgi:hypothetical protein